MLFTKDHINARVHGTTETTIFSGSIYGIRKNNELTTSLIGSEIYHLSRSGQDAILIRSNGFGKSLIEIPYNEIEWENCVLSHSEGWGLHFRIDARDILDHPLHDFIMEEYNFVCPIGEDNEVDENGISKNIMIFVDTYRTVVLGFYEDQIRYRYARITHGMKEMLLSYYSADSYSNFHHYNDLLSISTTVDHEHFRIKHR